MSKLATTIGYNNAPVTCYYKFDRDGYLRDIEVIFNGIDISPALSERQLDNLEQKCREQALAEYEESTYDQAIADYIESQTKGN